MILREKPTVLTLKHYVVLPFHQNRAEAGVEVQGERGRAWTHSRDHEAEVPAGKPSKAGPWCAESGHHTDEGQRVGCRKEEGSVWVWEGI